MAAEHYVVHYLNSIDISLDERVRSAANGAEC